MILVLCALLLGFVWRGYRHRVQELVKHDQVGDVSWGAKKRQLIDRAYNQKL